MEDRKRILHRLSYFNQVRERRVRIQNPWQSIGQKKENTHEPQKKESPKRKSLLSRLLLFFAKPKAPIKTVPVEVPQHKLKKFATKLKAVDKDKKLKTFIGPEVIAVSADEARAILDHNGQEYLEIIGELTAAYDLLGSNVTWQDRLN